MTLLIKSYLDVSYTEIVCGGCGVRYAMEKSYHTNRLSDGKGFYCPNGCRRVFGDTLQKALEDEKRNSLRLRTEIEELKRKSIAAKGEATKLKNKVKRAEAGVCTCCNRTFANLARHMKTKHGGKK